MYSNVVSMEQIKQKYDAEVKEKWSGSDAYKESDDKTKNYTKEQWDQIQDELSELMIQISNNKKDNPSSAKSQELVSKWRGFLTAYYYDCTIEILGWLGKMYIEDERFTENIDKYGNGTAQFMSNAINIYCKNNK